MATILEFGPFRIDGDAGILFHGAEPVSLGGRAVALLVLLTQRAGAPTSKDALIEAAWPGLAIEDSNLTVQIAAVRRVLGELAGGCGLDRDLATSRLSLRRTASADGSRRPHSRGSQ